MATKPQITTDQFLAAAKYRRTVYGLKGTSSVPDSRVEEIVKEVLSFTPSSYNTQPGRITIVVGDKHKQLWDGVIAAAEPVLKGAGEAVWAAMEPMFQGHKAAYGSILFWDRGQTIKEAQETHKSAAHMFAQWADHANGMAEILVWTALELEGLGANLQHMAALPGAEASIRKIAGVPDDYLLKANMVFGDKPGPQPEVPARLPISETLSLVK